MADVIRHILEGIVDVCKMGPVGPKPKDPPTTQVSDGTLYPTLCNS